MLPQQLTQPNPTLQYFIDETHESTGVQEGVCSLAIPNEQIAKLVASDAAAGDEYGNSVSVDGDTAVIGAYGDNVYTGSVYVFVRSGSAWTQQAKLTASDGTSNDYFGHSVSISGNTAVIGAYGDNPAGNWSGSAYVFVRSGSTWTQQAKLTAGDANVSDYFGYSVSASGDTAVISAHGNDSAGTDSGSAYVFTRSGSTWTQQAKLVADDSATGRMFGSSVSISGSTAIIGSYTDNHAGANAGSAYIFN